MRYVLFISEEFVLVKAVGAGDGVGGVWFENTDADKARFIEYLSERQSSVFIGVVDTADVEFQSENLPKLRRGDENRAIRNLVESRCTDKTLWQVTTRRQSVGQHNTVQVRLSAVGSQCCCAHWLSILQDNDVLVAELCLLADLSAGLMAGAGINVPIIVLPVSPQSYRIIGFDQHVPVIGRTHRCPVPDIEELVAQVDRTYQYLSRTGVADGETVAIYLGEVTEQEQLILTSKQIDIRHPAEFLSGSQVTSAKGINCVELAMRFMMKAAGKRPDRLMGHYRRSFFQRRIKHAYLAGILCCFTLGSAAVYAGSRITQSIEQLTDQVNEQHVSIDQRMAVYHDRFDADHSEVDALRTAVQIARRLDDLSRNTPMNLLQSLASQLANHPRVHITSVEWNTEHPDLLSEHDVGHEYLAAVTGYIDSTDLGIGDVSRRFNTFVSRLGSNSSIDFVDVLEAPAGLTTNTVSVTSESPASAMRFSLSVGASTPLEQ